MDRGAWWAMVHRVAMSRAQPKQLSIHCLTQCQCYVCGILPLLWLCGSVISPLLCIPLYGEAQFIHSPTDDIWVLSSWG